MFAAEERLGEHGELLVLELARFVEFHLRFDGLAAATLPLLRYVTLIVGHSDPSFEIFA